MAGYLWRRCPECSVLEMPAGRRGLVIISRDMWRTRSFATGALWACNQPEGQIVDQLKAAATHYQRPGLMDTLGLLPLDFVDRHMIVSEILILCSAMLFMASNNPRDQLVMDVSPILRLSENIVR